MKQYERFIFESYAFDEASKRIELNYSLDQEVPFTETIVLPEHMRFVLSDPEALDRALFMLHLIGGMSYFKTCLPKTIEIRSGKLSKEQAEFWNTVYTQGLGEFFYKNDIDFRELISFPAELTEEPTLPDLKADSWADSKKSKRVLTPIGGGKDSIVTIEALKSKGINQTLLRVGSHPLIDQVAKISGAPVLSIGRNLSHTLFEMNAEGALNGHVPITAYLSCLSIVLSELYGYTDVIFSNERSADEGNVEMHGMTINHQWSKSLEFETAFQKYLDSYVTKNVRYFSLLRPLSELHIVQIFTNYPKYFDYFTSCNANWRIVKERPHDRWCGACPKCAFAFAMLAAFLDKATVLKIFNDQNLFDDESLLPLFRELLGIEGIKPFECIGTPEETYAALMLADDKDEWSDTAVMKMFEKEGMDLFKKPESIVEAALTPSKEHAIPEDFRNLLPSA